MADSVWKTRPKGGAWALGVPPAPPRGPFGVCATREGQRGADFGGMPVRRGNGLAARLVHTAAMKSDSGGRQQATARETLFQAVRTVYCLK